MLTVLEMFIGVRVFLLCWSQEYDAEDQFPAAGLLLPLLSVLGVVALPLRSSSHLVPHFSASLVHVASSNLLFQCD